ncbi:MAG: hypothetical protein ACOX0M_08070 [Salinivirgaceae bacterium]|jgi:hypothetical protein|nr:DUF4348 domain-containing protein [Bacteroidales bacterium]
MLWKRKFTTNRAITLACITALLVTFSCKTTEEGTRKFTSSESVKPDKKESRPFSKPENFDKFYNRFHTDSTFQMSRIKFPLQGKIIQGDQETKWSRDNWIMMKTRIYDIDTTMYKTTFKKRETSFYQKFWLENSGLSSEYRFELIGNKWFLVYALDQNL